MQTIDTLFNITFENYILAGSCTEKPCGNAAICKNVTSADNDFTCICSDKYKGMLKQGNIIGTLCSTRGAYLQTLQNNYYCFVCMF